MVGGGVGGWLFYIVVAIAPITAISMQYIIIGSINISISSTLAPPLVYFNYNVFSIVYHTGITVSIAFFPAVTYNYIKLV